MKILLAEEQAGHPFWRKKMFSFVLIDTVTHTASRVPTGAIVRRVYDYSQWGGAVEYSFTSAGVEAQVFYCSSGSGKTQCGDPILVIPSSSYDQLIVLESEEMRINERNYNGNWRDNSDFEKEDKE